MENIQDNLINWKRKIITFITGQTISLFGSFLVQYAIVWYITLETKSGVYATISIIVSFLPQVLVSLFAGVWADKYNKKKLIMYSDAMIAISTLILAIFFFCGIRYLWLIFVISAIRSFGSGIQMPAVNSFIPELIPEDKLMRVNGINTTIQSLMMVVCPVISGALLVAFNSMLEYIFFIDVFTAIIGIGLTYIIKYIHKKHDDIEIVSHMNEMKDGIRYIKNHKTIKKLLYYYAILSFLFAPVAFLTTLMVTRTFGPEVWRLTVHETAFGIGAVLGGIAISIWGGFKNRIITIIFACFGFGMLSVAMGLSTVFWLYVSFMFLSGILMAFFSTPWTVYLQETVEPEMLGRVFSFAQIVTTIAMPLGMLVFGPIADITKIEYILIITGILTMIETIIVYFDKTIKGDKENLAKT